ncbi:putative Ig domain-containing protein, partial [Flavobacterium longum]|uniref:putative Ig domain-containing protein n=1 Tax=Flavobacterium longum TaxID=1299340 RepID=UPI0039EA3A74
SFGVVITVNDVAPNSLVYTSPNVFTVGNTIANLNPSVTGNVVSYSVSPALPSGLTLNTSTGVISGTPAAVTATATYTVTATNSGGSTTFGIVITVNDVAPSSLTYTSPNVFTVGNTITNLNPSVTGSVVSYSVSPSLPLGLNLNTSTGVISGTPTAVTATATYTVTATNSGGSTTFGIVITVNDVAPSSLTYTSPNVFTVGSAISNLNPSVTGNVVSYSVSPSLPLGLNLNTSTGVISGTPTAVTATATYTVTASNTGGSTTFGVVIAVNDVAPSGLSYTTPNIFTVDEAIVPLAPTVGGNVVLFSVSPGLPDGLVLDPITGVISGTPTTETSASIYTVTATNSGGMVSFDIVITVNPHAPFSLVYPTPNVFTVGSTIIDLIPAASGVIDMYTIVPALPAGLSLDTSTGIISGTPTAVTPPTNFLVTATNAGGNVSAVLSITVNDVAPNSLTYTSPNVFTVGNAISNLNPSVTGNVVSYSVSPALPSGLTLNTST